MPGPGGGPRGGGGGRGPGRPGGFGGPRPGGFGGGHHMPPPRPPRPHYGGGWYRPYRNGGCCGCALPVIGIAAAIAGVIAMLLF